MYAAPTGYRELVQDNDRRETVAMTLGVFIDSTSADDMGGVAGSALPFSNGAQLVDSRYDLDTEMATYEGDGIPTAIGSGVVVPPLEATSSINTGWWSSAISEADGSISFEMSVAFSDGEPVVHRSALTVYTDGPDVLEAAVVFTKDGVSETVVPTYHWGYFVASGNHDYDAITVRITKLDAPYRHIRLTELEFGDSVSISTARITNEITFIDEVDPIQQGMPMRELDFDLINVRGEYDEDNPNSRFDRLAIGNPIQISMVIVGDDAQYTVPMGRFVLAERQAHDSVLTITAYDTRWYMTRMYNAWSISTAEDLGTTLDRLLTALEVAHTIEDSVYEVYPSSDYAFDTETNVLDDIQRVAQAYGLTFIPNRVGTLIVDTDFPSGEYGVVPPKMQFTWPESSQLNRYNVIDVVYGSDRYTRDLRSDLNTARTVLTVSNPLIRTQAHAMAVCNRIVAHLYSKAVRVEWTSDPAMDLGDTVSVNSAWTLGGVPPTYKAVKREIRFNGMFVETTTLIN